MGDEVASVEAAPIAGASSVQTPAVDSQTAANAPPEKAAMALSYQEKTANALRDAMATGATADEAVPIGATQPAQEAAGDASKPPVEGEQQAVDDAEPAPEDYGPEDVKAALKRIHPDPRKILHDAYYRSEEIKKLGYKVEDLRLWANAGLTPERMLTTLQRFPVPEAEVEALRHAGSWQQFNDDFVRDPRAAILGLARTVPEPAFRQFVAEAANAAEVLDPQRVTQRDMSKARGWIATLKDRGTRLGDENMIAAAEIIEKDMGFDATAKEPEIPEEYRRRMSELERREQEGRQREQMALDQHRAGFENAVYTTVKASLEAEAAKSLGDTLSPDQKSWVLGRALDAVERDITGNEVLMRTIRQMVQQGPMDQAHHAYVSKQISEIGRRLVVTNLSTQLKELKKLSAQASPPVRAVAPSQATVAARPAPRREPLAQGATPPPAPARIELKRGGGVEAYTAGFRKALGLG